MSETLIKTYLELAQILPADCKSCRELALEKRISNLEEALRMYMSNAAAAADCFEDGKNETAYEYLMVARTKASHTLSAEAS